MEKIVTSAKNVLLEGKAEKDGVSFRAAQPASFLLGVSSGVFATVGEDGSIKCNPVPRESAIDSKIDQMSKKVRIAALILAGILFITHIALILAEMAPGNLLLFLTYLVAATAVIHEGVTIFAARTFGDKDMQSFSKFLAAMNAVANAYLDLGKVPTVYQAKKYPIYTGSNPYLTVENAALATLLISTGLVAHLPSLWCLIAMILLAIVIWVLWHRGFLFFWQYMVLSEPESIHYEVAIEALKVAINVSDLMEPISQNTMYDLLIDTIFSEENCASCEANSKLSNSTETENNDCPAE